LNTASLCRKLYIKLVIGLLVGTALEFYDRWAVMVPAGDFLPALVPVLQQSKHTGALPILN
jgi:hypothetical protein